MACHLLLLEFEQRAVGHGKCDRGGVKGDGSEHDVTALLPVAGSVQYLDGVWGVMQTPMGSITHSSPAARSVWRQTSHGLGVKGDGGGVEGGAGGNGGGEGGGGRHEETCVWPVASSMQKLTWLGVMHLPAIGPTVPTTPMPPAQAPPQWRHGLTGGVAGGAGGVDGEYSIAWSGHGASPCSAPGTPSGM